jgi:hypothetical protein
MEIEERGGQHLNGDFPIQLGVAGAVDLAHAPGADRREDFVGTQFYARTKRHMSDEVKFSRSGSAQVLYYGPLGKYPLGRVTRRSETNPQPNFLAPSQVHGA